MVKMFFKIWNIFATILKKKFKILFITNFLLLSSCHFVIATPKSLFIERCLSPCLGGVAPKRPLLWSSSIILLFGHRCCVGSRHNHPKISFSLSLATASEIWIHLDQSEGDPKAIIPSLRLVNGLFVPWASSRDWRRPWLRWLVRRAIKPRPRRVFLRNGEICARSKWAQMRRGREYFGIYFALRALLRQLKEEITFIWPHCLRLKELRSWKMLRGEGGGTGDFIN